MTKKNFAASLRKTVTSQQKVMEARFAVADSTFLSGKPVAELVPPALAVALTDGSTPAQAAPVKDVLHVTRDTFSMPAGDYALIEQLRVRAAREGRNTNKSEVIRAGLQSLMELEPELLVAILDGLEKVKPGRK